MLRNLPQVTKNLLLLNITMYIIAMVLVSNQIQLGEEFGSYYLNSVNFKPYQIVSHMFMHSLQDPFHIFINMFLLFMFGAHLERVWGARRYFIFYISCGLGAFLLYNSIGIWNIMELKNSLIAAGNDITGINNSILNGTLDPMLYRIPVDVGGQTISEFQLQALKLSDLGVLTQKTALHANGDLLEYCFYNESSLVGASGAIFGLLAGFAMLFPNTQLMLLFPPIPIKAKYLIGAYLLFEVYSSIYNTSDHIAHLAHVGGAVVGIIFILVWRRRDRGNF